MNLPDWMLLLQWGDAGWGDEMVRGMLMTLAVAMAAFLLGIVIGTLGAALKLSRYMLLRFIGEAYTTLIRGVPDLLVQALDKSVDNAASFCPAGGTITPPPAVTGS